ncbi:MAG TPA: hypothetical protein VNM45_19405 [Bacillus sp. (in: firmicutes)]|nr:hypothetical protein [Bacillus sp. (in: firmicutes)]
MVAFEEEFEKFFETYVMGRYKDAIRREEEKFQRISKQLEKMKDQEKIGELLDQINLRDPFHSS